MDSGGRTKLGVSLYLIVVGTHSSNVLL